MTTNEPPEYPDYGSVPSQGSTPPPPPPPTPGPPTGTPGGYAPPPSYPPAGSAGWYPPQGGYLQPPPTSQKAVWAMISGIIGIALVLLCFGGFGLSIVPGITAIVLGAQSKNEIARSNGALQGHGQAIAGLVMGIITVVITVLALVLIGVFIAA